MTQCFKPDWKDRCCCNCKYQCVVSCHPWNKQIGKGYIRESLGYGCMAQLQETQKVIFFEHEHGLCEMHERREDESNETSQKST